MIFARPIIHPIDATITRGALSSGRVMLNMLRSAALSCQRSKTCLPKGNTAAGWVAVDQDDGQWVHWYTDEPHWGAGRRGRMRASTSRARAAWRAVTRGEQPPTSRLQATTARLRGCDQATFSLLGARLGDFETVWITLEQLYWVTKILSRDPMCCGPCRGAHPASSAARDRSRSIKPRP